MKRRPLFTTFLAAALAVAIASCGGGSSSSGTSTADAKSSIENAAGVHLTTVALPAGAKKQGVNGAYSNQTSAVKDKQIVFVFVLKDSDTVKQLKDTLSSFNTQGKATVLTHGNVAVIYGNAGNDHLSDVKKALNQL